MKSKDIIKIGKSVLAIEASALRDLAGRLDQGFARAVDLLAQTESRVIVTGIGKSGLVARKIASTLSSCGTPSMFLHPVEAGHGDLGMITPRDILIAISYSGNTREIVDLLEFVKRIGIKLIGITGNASSMLGEYSDEVLEARVEREAEPHGLVPTASSTAALAMGDALAIALMQYKRFDEKDFALCHPKGQLGKRLLKIENLMHHGKEIPLVIRNTPMRDLLNEMSEKHLGMTCVVDDSQRLLGVITDGDLRRKLQTHGKALLEKSAEECMTPEPLSISKESLATEALNTMESRHVTSLVVTDHENRVEGIIHLHDLWRTEMF